MTFPANTPPTETPTVPCLVRRSAEERNELGLIHICFCSINIDHHDYSVIDTTFNSILFQPGINILFSIENLFVLLWTEVNELRE